MNNTTTPSGPIDSCIKITTFAIIEVSTAIGVTLLIIVIKLYYNWKIGIIYRTNNIQRRGVGNGYFNAVNNWG